MLGIPSSGRGGCSYVESLSNLHPIPQNAGVRAGIPDSLSTQTLCKARSINNKTRMLQNYFAAQNVDLAYMTNIWVKGDETVALKELASQSQTRGCGR